MEKEFETIEITLHKDLIDKIKSYMGESIHIESYCFESVLQAVVNKMEYDHLKCNNDENTIDWMINTITSPQMLNDYETRLKLLKKNRKHTSDKIELYEIDRKIKQLEFVIKYLIKSSED